MSERLPLPEARDMSDSEDEDRPTEEQIQAYLAMGGGSELHEAVLLGDVERVRWLLALGHDPNDSSGNRGMPPLMYACGFCGVGLSDGDYAGCVAALIRAGAEVNVVYENNGFTPLHYIHARRLDAPGIAKVLVDAGANVSARTLWGHTVLGDLASHYSQPMLKASRRTTPIFLRAGADLDTGGVPFNGWSGHRDLAPPPGTFHDPYLQKIHDTPGGFKAYEKQHLQAVTATFEPKFPQLPKEVVRHLMTFCFHLGFYVYSESDSEAESDSEQSAIPGRDRRVFVF